MKVAATVFFRLMVRPMLRERWRSLLVILAVALGVAVVLAIDLAGNAAAVSFHSSMQTLTGDNDFEVTAAGGVPDSVVGTLERLPYPIRVTPRIEDHAAVEPSGETVPLLGLDLIGEANDGSGQGLRSKGLRIAAASDELSAVNDPDAVWTTRSLGGHAGSRLTLLINDRKRVYTVRGVIAGAAAADAVVMDMAAAEQATGKAGRVDRILIKVPDKPDFAWWQQKLRAALPQGVELQAQGSETAANRRMLAAFRWNLRILSYIALLVGAFLIYNTISVSVVRRRAEIGVVRALGASRRAVLLAFLAEAAVFGAVGAAVALPLGRLMAGGAVRLLSATVNALYVTSRPGSLALSVVSVVPALLAGIGVALLSALAPAREAAGVSPSEAMARGRREYAVRVSRWRDLLIAGLLAGCAAAAATAPAVGGKPIFGYLAALLLVAAMALSIPAMVSALAPLSSGAAARFAGVEALLASRSLGGSLRRTSVLVGTLAMAIAMMTSVAIMVGSFRQTVITWMDSEMPADLYLRPAGAVGEDRHPTIEPKLADRIARLPGVEEVSRFRAYDIDYQGLPATLASADVDPKHERQRPEFLSGNPVAAVMQEIAAGEAAVSEPFANKHHVRAGDTLTLPLGGKKAQFRVAGIFYDYGNDGGYILLSRATLLRYLPDPAASNLAVYLDPGANLETVRREIQEAAANSDVLVFSNRELREQGIRTFDQTFAITYALEAVAVVVAVLGIAGALITIVMDRRREFGLLRFLGATRQQVRRLILMEAGLIGVYSNLAGLALGYCLSLILIFVINRQSFGWTIRFHWPVAVLLGALTVVYVSTVLAGLYPARMAQRLNPIEAVHEE